MRVDGDIPPCLIFIDKEGRWFHKGMEMINREFIRLFYQHMTIDSLGRYIIKMGGDHCYVEVEDTAFLVRRVVFKNQDRPRHSRFILHLSDDTQEDLLPETLRVGDGNVLYCKVRNRSFPARFDRPAYYQLSQYVEEENEEFYLPLNERKYTIRQAASRDPTRSGHKSNQ